MHNDSSLTICEKQNAKLTTRIGASMYLTGIEKKNKARYQVNRAHSNVCINYKETITVICKMSSNIIDPSQVVKILNRKQNIKEHQ